MKTNKTKITIGILIGAILLSSCTLAFSVSMPYMENKELYLLPGEGSDIVFVLQTGGEAEDTTIKASVLDGLAVMQITDEKNEYLIHAGEQVKVNTQVKIPSNVKIGDAYPVRLSFTTVTATGAGTFGLGSSIEQKFDVVVGERPPEEKAEEITGEGKASQELGKVNASIYLVFGVIALIIIVAVILVIRKKKAQSQ